MNKDKAIIYTLIMLAIPFVGILFYFKNFKPIMEAFQMASLGTLFVNGQLFLLGLIAEAVKFNNDPNYKQKGKVFWHEWVETTFAIWIIGALIVVVLALAGRIG